MSSTFTQLYPLQSDNTFIDMAALSFPKHFYLLHHLLVFLPLLAILQSSNYIALKPHTIMAFVFGL